MKLARAVLVLSWKEAVVIEQGELLEEMARRGYRITGLSTGRVLRDELQGAPVFAELIGPMWGGEETPLRYETVEANRVISMG